MKKVTPFLIIGIFIIAVLVIFNIGKRTYKEINLETIENKMEQKETFAIYIGSSRCGACQNFKPILNEVISDYKLTVYYIDVNKLSDSEFAKFLTIINFGDSTPALYFIKNGEYLQSEAIKGLKYYDYVVNKFKTAGFIEE